MFEMMYSLDSLQPADGGVTSSVFHYLGRRHTVRLSFIEPIDKDLFEFQKVYSLPHLHGSGIGRFIIEQGVSYLKSIHPGPFTVKLNVNRHNPAVGFYKHMGFHEAATRDFPIGNGYYMNDYIMQMEVDN